MTKTSKKRRSAKLIALAAGLTTAGALAASSNGIEVDDQIFGDIDYGIICPKGSMTEVPAEGTALGYIVERDGPHKIELTTQIVPALTGIGFGVKATNVSGAPLAPVTISVKHPPFPGITSTQDVWQDSFIAGGTNYNYFTFEFPFELQTGRWEFRASIRDRPLYHVAFEVVPPEQVPDLTKICPGPPLIG